MNQFQKLCTKICLSCRFDCCNSFGYTPFLAEYDKLRIKKIIKDDNLFDGNDFNTKKKVCPFLNQKEKTCLLHEYRPLDCRLYPYAFWFERGQLELWLDLKCPMSQCLTQNKRFYKNALQMAKKELVYWSEGEIFGFLISRFNIEKFKKQLGKRKKKYYHPSLKTLKNLKADLKNYGRVKEKEFTI
jgi:Fe-S-cluster containining protein